MSYPLPKLSKSGGDEKSSSDTFQKNNLIKEIFMLRIDEVKSFISISHQIEKDIITAGKYFEKKYAIGPNVYFEVARMLSTKEFSLSCELVVDGILICKIDGLYFTDTAENIQNILYNLFSMYVEHIMKFDLYRLYLKAKNLKSEMFSIDDFNSLCNTKFIEDLLVEINAPQGISHIATRYRNFIDKIM